MFRIAVGLLCAVAFAEPPDAEIAKILADRIDVRKQGVGIVVGVTDASGRRVIAHGRMAKEDARRPDGDTVFEIGSVSKVFTALLVEDAVLRGKLTWDDPVAKHLPEGSKVPSRGGREITLRDLVTHTSGLPRMPANFQPADPRNPYADYGADKLLAALAGAGLTRDIGSKFEYSNFGAAVLGHALGRVTGEGYGAMMRSRITAPLKMSSTMIALTDGAKARFAQGHDPSLAPTRSWEQDAFAPAGAIRSTANDMLLFLDACLGRTKSPLAPAFTALLAERRPIVPSKAEVAHGWLIQKTEGSEIVWHNGGTGGFRSFVGFDAKSGVGVVALSNVGSPEGVDDIGRHILDPSQPLLPPKKERKEITLAPEVLDKVVGRYEFAPGVVLAVTREGSQLSVQLTGQGKLPAYPESEREFFLKVVEASLTFSEGQVVLHQGGRDQTAKRIE